MKINFSVPEFTFSKFSFNKENLKYVLAIISLYVFFLIANLPANIFLSLVSLPSNVSINSVTGTAWSGKAKQVSVSGIQLGAVNWQIHPLSLLIGYLSVDINAVNNQQYINTELSLSSSGKMDLEETRFSIDLSSLQPLTYGMPVSYVGKASGYFPVSFFHKNNYVGVNGKLNLSGIEMTSPQQQSFGDFVVDFRAENEGATSGKISGTGGALDIDGQLSLSKLGMLDVSAKIAAREANSSLAQMIVFFGKKDASGRIQVNSNLKLW